MTIGDARLENRVEEFRIGRVASRTLTVLFANPVTFLVLSALLSVPSVLLSYGLLKARALASSLMPVFARALVMGVLDMVLLTALSCLVQAALTKAVFSSLNEERPSIGQSLSAVMNNFLSLTVIGVLTALGFVLGLTLLVVPCVVLMVVWAVVVPVKVAENTGVIETFRRSRILTREYRWPIFLVSLGYVLIAVGASLLAHRIEGIGFTVKITDFTVSYVAVDWVERTIVTGINAVITASIYYELRLVKEGMGDQHVADAFD